MINCISESEFKKAAYKLSNTRKIDWFIFVHKHTTCDYDYLFCSRLWCGVYLRCWSDLPTRWRCFYRYQKWHTVLPRFPGLTLIGLRHYWPLLNPQEFVRKVDTGTADRLVCLELNYLQDVRFIWIGILTNLINLIDFKDQAKFLTGCIVT